MIGEIINAFKFAFNNRKELKIISREVREIQGSIKKAIRGKTAKEKEITKQEMRDILMNVDDLVEALIDMTEDDG